MGWVVCNPPNFLAVVIREQAPINQIFTQSKILRPSPKNEVFNLFAASIPQEGLSRMERGRKIQSIVPDMRISIPEEGNFVPRLHELKIISSSKTRYNPHRQGQEAMKAVDKRASRLNAEYIKKNLDHWGPGGRWQVRTEEADELALTTSFVRRSLSVVGVRAQARLLLGRLEMIGPRAAAAAGRRNYALNLERIWANQRRADALSCQMGKMLLRRGHFKID